MLQGPRSLPVCVCLILVGDLVRAGCGQTDAPCSKKDRSLLMKPGAESIGELLSMLHPPDVMLEQLLLKQSLCALQPLPRGQAGVLPPPPLQAKSAQIVKPARWSNVGSS